MTVQVLTFRPAIGVTEGDPAVFALVEVAPEGARVVSAQTVRRRDVLPQLLGDPGWLARVEACARAVALPVEVTRAA